VTASAGNHALGVAWAARRLGRAATVVVPESVSPAKLDALLRAGCHVERVGVGYDQAEAYALAMAGPGRRYLSAYNDEDVIAGQATIGAELEQLHEPITVVVPTGGGGLLAGIALWAEQRAGVRVVGVESAASRALSTAVASGAVATVPVSPTLADGLAGNLEPGAITPAIVRDRVEDIVAVTEQGAEVFGELSGPVRDPFRRG
jgi:threonine dehydratase